MGLDFETMLEVSKSRSRFALSPRESDVGMIRAILRHESAWGGGLSHTVLKALELGRDLHVCEEDAGAIEEAETLKPDRYGWSGDELKVLNKASILGFAG